MAVDHIPVNTIKVVLHMLKNTINEIVILVKFKLNDTEQWSLVLKGSETITSQMAKASLHRTISRRDPEAWCYELGLVFSVTYFKCKLAIKYKIK